MENTKGSTQTIWIADFTINEPLHEVASSISAAYTRMSINFPENTSAKVWDEQALIWHRYYTNINKMSFSTHEEGVLEIERIGKINREVLETEQNLITKTS
jgi:hypothetical protein